MIIYKHSNSNRLYESATASSLFPFQVLDLPLIKAKYGPNVHAIAVWLVGRFQAVYPVSSGCTDLPESSEQSRDVLYDNHASLFQRLDE